MANTAPDVLRVGRDRSASRAREDYVKAIHQLGDPAPVRAADVARYLGVSPVSVSKAKRQLELEGLLKPGTERTGTLRLTARGRKLAVAMVRRHRLLETFLHRMLAVPLERVHAEAERIEHAISDDIALRLAELLDHPERDPHGHRIPYAVGDACSDGLPALASLPLGARLRVVSLDDRDDDAVRALVVAGVLPGVVATIVERDAHAVRLRCGRRSIALRHALAARVRCADA